MAEMLDRTRPFETSWGFVGENEPFFYQDGKEFNSEGKRINIPEEELAPKQTKRGRKAKAEEPVVSEEPILAEPKTPENIEDNSDLL